MDLDRWGSPPPQYSESNTATDSKSDEHWRQGHTPWLVQRTSIVIETSAATADSASSLRESTTSPSRSTDQRNRIRGIFRRDDPSESLRSGSNSQSNAIHDGQLGTQVTIEASQPIRSTAERRIELKGLEQAASTRRWPGSARAPEPWGKLKADPELWDQAGDTFIWFGYHREEPSFRINAALLQETRSDHLASKLREGRRNTAASPRPASQADSSSSPLTGMKSLSLSGKARAPQRVETTAPVRYDVHFPPPPNAVRLDVLRHMLTTRNLVALLKDKPLVGLTFHQALVDLQERVEDLQLFPGLSSAQIIVRYLMRNHFHIVSGVPAAAAGLLAWSEDNLWREGWREGFVHCSGMLGKLRPMPEFQSISHVSNTLLERSRLEMHVKVQESEHRLRDFRFDDVWPARTNGHLSVPPAFASFRRFLQSHYEKVYKSWPPRPAEASEDWLSRSLVTQLQADFCALYNYYVNQDIVWDASGRLLNRGMEVLSPSESQNGKPKTSGLDLEQTLLALDQKLKYPHIPHPFPLFPQSVQVGDAARQAESKSLFVGKDKSLKKRVIAASREATNAILLGPEMTNNNLVKAFLTFEQSDRVGEEDPRIVRQERWVLLYGILQVLSHIALETPQMWSKANADYFVYAKLRGMPPWTGPEVTAYEDASTADLYRWLRPRTS